MKIFNIFFCVIFIIFAALQYNDPDPYVWMPIYLYGSFFCWMAYKNKFYPAAYWTGIFVCAVYATYKVFTPNGVIDWIREHHAQNIAGTMKAETPWVEETREFFGLMIVIGVLLINFFYGRSKSKSIRNKASA